MSESPELRQRVEDAAAGAGVTAEQLGDAMHALGLGPEDAAEHAADLAARNGRPADAERRVLDRRAEGCAKLSEALGLDDTSELLAVQFDGQRYSVALRDPRGGEPAHVRVAPAELLTLSNLQAAVFAATGRLTKAPRRGSQDWRRIVELVEAAAEHVEPDDDPADEWRFRLERYLDGRLGADRHEAVPAGAPFTDDDGRLHVHAPSFGDWLAHLPGLERGDATPALRDVLRFECFKHQHGPRDQRTRRTYWRSPEPWRTGK